MTDQIKYTSKLIDTSVLVIGGTSGIGFAVAEACLEHGCHVTISSSTPQRIDSALSRLREAYPSRRDRLSAHRCDLSGDDLEAQLVKLLEDAGTVDHIVFTAGDKLSVEPISEVTLAGIAAAGRLRFVAPLLLAKHAPKHLTPGHTSSLTFTNGIIAERPIPNWTVVAGYAAALPAVVRNLAVDLKPLRVNCVTPGPVKTEMWGTPEEREKMETPYPGECLTGVITGPENVAEAYLYAMKDANLTGQTVLTDGGITIT
ncbi:MAG: hypothetical protein M1833_002944 [Piccolia ochrophora]|nr:MAG: hypothetical protein M1833_002944 [Piccolia ochrophora]